MIKLVKSGVAYYFEREEHLKMALEDSSDLRCLQMCMFAVNITTNIILKCRYDFETLMDKATGVKS